MKKYQDNFCINNGPIRLKIGPIRLSGRFSLGPIWFICSSLSFSPPLIVCDLWFGDKGKHKFGHGGASTESTLRNPMSRLRTVPFQLSSSPGLYLTPFFLPLPQLKSVYKLNSLKFHLFFCPFFLLIFKLYNVISLCCVLDKRGC